MQPLLDDLDAGGDAQARTGLQRQHWQPATAAGRELFDLHPVVLNAVANADVVEAGRIIIEADDTCMTRLGGRGTTERLWFGRCLS